MRNTNCCCCRSPLAAGTFHSSSVSAPWLVQRPRGSVSRCSRCCGRRGLRGMCRSVSGKQQIEVLWSTVVAERFRSRNEASARMSQTEKNSPRGARAHRLVEHMLAEVRLLPGRPNCRSNFSKMASTRWDLESNLHGLIEIVRLRPSRGARGRSHRTRCPRADRRLSRRTSLIVNVPEPVRVDVVLCRAEPASHVTFAAFYAVARSPCRTGHRHRHRMCRPARRSWTR